MSSPQVKAVLPVMKWVESKQQHQPLGTCWSATSLLLSSSIFRRSVALIMAKEDGNASDVSSRNAVLSQYCREGNNYCRSCKVRRTREGLTVVTFHLNLLGSVEWRRQLVWARRSLLVWAADRHSSGDINSNETPLDQHCLVANQLSQQQQQFQQSILLLLQFATGSLLLGRPVISKTMERRPSRAVPERGLYHVATDSEESQGIVAADDDDNDHDDPFLVVGSFAAFSSSFPAVGMAHHPRRRHKMSLRVVQRTVMRNAIFALGMAACAFALYLMFALDPEATRATAKKHRLSSATGIASSSPLPPTTSESQCKQRTSILRALISVPLPWSSRVVVVSHSDRPLCSLPSAGYQSAKTTEQAPYGWPPPP